jgi:hypothetical protein
MLKKLMIGAAISLMLVSGPVFGQNTGGDKATAGQKPPTVGLNPQPLPPGARQPPGTRRYQLRRKHKRHPNAITIKQK